MAPAVGKVLAESRRERRRHDIDDALVLIRADCLVGDKNGLISVGSFDLYAAEEAGLQDKVRVGETGPQTNGATLVVDPVLGEIELSFERFGIGIRDRDGDIQSAAALLEILAQFAGRVGKIQQAAFVDVEIEIDRVERNDCREHGLVGLHEIAGRDQPAVDTAAERRLDFRIFHVERRTVGSGLRAADIGLGRIEFAAAIIQRLRYDPTPRFDG